MDTWVLWFLLLQSILQYPQPVGDGLDEATRLRMEARARLQEEEKIRLEREVEQLALMKPSVGTWGDLLWSALQPWQVWPLAGLLLLLLALWSMCRKRSLRRAEHKEENGAANEGEGRNVDASEEAGGDEEEEFGNGTEEEFGNEEEEFGNEEEEEEEEENDVNGEENSNDDGNAQEVDNVAANEEGGAGNGAGSEAANAANSNQAGNEVDNRDCDDIVGRMAVECIQRPAHDLQEGCQWTTSLMNAFVIYCRHVLSKSFYPVLEEAIGVGSAFEGWSPHEQDVLYQVLIPMTPPRGHSFHLELDTAGQRHMKDFRIRVEQECTCRSEQQGSDNMLCFLHSPEEELRASQDPSLLHTLCTGSYLDVDKTAHWFCHLVRAVWPALPQARNWHLALVPSRRSCQFRVSNGQESYWIKMLFGVRQGNSDVFVSSEYRPGHTSSTSWPETYAVAEAKFFDYLARRAPPDSLHLQCLQLWVKTCLQLGTGISPYAMKTIVMHLLSSTPLSLWRRRHFVRRLMDISHSLCVCVRGRRLNHFIIGNRSLPEDIGVPVDVLLARPGNLFYNMTVDPVAHSQAMGHYLDLYQWLEEIIKNQQ